jgi:hypothetical protein
VGVGVGVGWRCGTERTLGTGMAWFGTGREGMGLRGGARVAILVTVRRHDQ